MRFQLHKKIYHFIWSIWKKKSLVVNGYCISYCELPWMLLIGSKGSKSWFQNGMCITYIPDQTIMIFISSKENPSTISYTIYHEYIEGLCSLKQREVEVSSLFLQAMESLKEYDSNIGGQFMKSVEKKEDKTQQSCHCIALAIELALAKSEMDSDKFRAYLENALLERL